MTQTTAISSNLTIGMDLGDTTCEVCVLEQGGKKPVATGTLPMTKEALTEFVSQYPAATVVFEVGGQSRWVQQLFRLLGIKNIAADPRQLKLISQSRRKNDKKDAYLLACAGRGMPELLNPITHRSLQAHADRAVSKARHTLVTTRTKLVNHLRGVVKTEGGRIKATAQYFHSHALEQIPEHLRPALEPLIDVLAAIHDQLLTIDREMKRIARDRYPEVELLMGIFSVGLTTAFAFVTTIEDPSRFRRARACGAYLGMTPRQRESGSISPELNITKAGDGHLRRLLVLCAHHLLGPFGKDCRLRRWGLELCGGTKKGRKRAVVAVARKLAVQMMAIWKSGRAFDPWRGMPLSETPAEAQPDTDSSGTDIVSREAPAA